MPLTTICLPVMALLVLAYITHPLVGFIAHAVAILAHAL